MPAIKRNRIAGRAGRVDDLQRRPDERELIDPVRKALGKIEIFQVPDSDVVYIRRWIARDGAHANVIRSIELSEDLTDLGRYELVVIKEVILPERSAGGRTRDHQNEHPRAKKRDIRGVGLAEDIR